MSLLMASHAKSMTKHQTSGKTLLSIKHIVPEAVSIEFWESVEHTRI